ncbi:ABC transporter substrate-binding protein [Desulfosporosinus lacus]|uniref:Thiamine pyrimidine synthase n=1 Tax=Desulfosporosinus lacus DSM 15449 TaxID=1121420 RepID=A0A1M5RLN4_9FIRM|nr:ABC transporter substrate-binding protein [Desulfosporosinus lacus]SHH27036.1 NitT/TauT family transport system substrate-binding protein [Desulfosporosinus lacus DSM 15449]
MKIKYLLGIGLLAFGVLLSGCAAKDKDAAGSKQIEEVKVASWSQPITEQTNLLAGEEKSFYKENGIKVNFIPGAGGGDAIKNILTGAADIAFTDPGSLYFALDKGEKLRVIYNIYPQNVFNVVSLTEKNITKPEDLKGKKIGVYSHSSGTRQNLLLLLHQAGLSEKDVTIVETGLLNFAPLMQGQVDATAATDTGLETGKQKGLSDVNVIEVKDYLNIPSDVFVVTEKTYQEKKDLLISFLKGYQQSAQWMIDNPQEAASLAVKLAIDGKDVNSNLKIIDLRNSSSLSSDPKDKTLGALDPEVLQKGADIYQGLGLIENKLDMPQAVIQDLIPKK